MATAQSLEDRVSALERKLEQMAKRLEPVRKPDWVSRVVGSFADCPEFDEVLRLGREFRREQNAIEPFMDDAEDAG